MNFQMILALVPVFIKYAPLAYAFLQTQGPGVQAFLKEIVSELPKNADGSVNWSGISIFTLIPIAFKYGPQVEQFLQTEGVQLQHLIEDIQTALKGAPLPAPAPIVTPAVKTAPPPAPVSAAPTQGTGAFTS